MILLSIRHSDSSLRLFIYPCIVLHGTACPSVLAHGALEMFLQMSFMRIVAAFFSSYHMIMICLNGANMTYLHAMVSTGNRPTPPPLAGIYTQLSCKYISYSVHIHNNDGVLSHDHDLELCS